MSISAKVVLDSVSPHGVRLTTMELRYPRMIHGEFMTHRVFSRNASSSRAVPVEKLVYEAEHNPAMPERWGLHNKGMQDGGVMTQFGEKTARQDWLAARDDAVARVKTMIERPERASKQIINRLLEPFTHINVILTSTYWQNFYVLRDHSDADPTMYALARAVIDARDTSKPLERDFSDWHLPYTCDADIDAAMSYALDNTERLNIVDLDKLDGTILSLMQRMSAARCARVSYLTHEGKEPTVEGDLKTFSRLLSSQPLHASPAEHQAQPDRVRHAGYGAQAWENPHLHGNFVGWKQHRKYLVGEASMEYGDVLGVRRNSKAYA